MDGMVTARVAIEALRRQVATIEAGGAQREDGAERRVALDGGAVDAALGGGLRAGMLHEVIPAALADAPAASGFALGLALCAATGQRPILWVRMKAATRETGMLHADGLAALGLDPARLVLLHLDGALPVLSAGVDIARCTALGAAILELWGDPKALDLTSERRLLLAAEQSGVTVILLRPGARAAPGGAETRWSVASGPARALPMNAPGPPTFDLHLQRHRHGPPGGRWRLEWNRDEQRFQPPPLLRDPDALSRLGSAAPDPRSALRRRVS